MVPPMHQEHWYSVNSAAFQGEATAASAALMRRREHVFRYLAEKILSSHHRPDIHLHER